MTLKNKLAEFCCGWMSNLKFWVNKHKITFEVDVCHGEYWKVEISEVYTYLFHDTALADSEADLEPEDFIWENSKIELNGFLFEHKGVVFQTKSKASHCASLQGNFNICLELWNAPLLIKANKLHINDEIFDLHTGNQIKEYKSKSSRFESLDID